jgi:hypothetical protein
LRAGPTVYLSIQNLLVRAGDARDATLHQVRDQRAVIAFEMLGRRPSFSQQSTSGVTISMARALLLLGPTRGAKTTSGVRPLSSFAVDCSPKNRTSAPARCQPRSGRPSVPSLVCDSAIMRGGLLGAADKHEARERHDYRRKLSVAKGSLNRRKKNLAQHEASALSPFRQVSPNKLANSSNDILFVT